MFINTSLATTTTSILAFIVQTVVVFGGNSRLFGLLKPGSGWYTNVEMSQVYASLVTPARFAFAIWGVIYTWEAIAMMYLAFTPEKELPAGWDPSLWIAANVFQSLWAVLFATEQLALSALALLAIAVSLTLLGASMPLASGAGYWLLAAPIWLHAGWTSAATIVNFNLALAATGSSATVQLVAAFASNVGAVGVGVGVVLGSNAAFRDGSCPYAFTTPLPFALALWWALRAIRAELHTPELIKESAAYAAIGEARRNTLEYTTAACAFALALLGLERLLTTLAMHATSTPKE